MSIWRYFSLCGKIRNEGEKDGVEAEWMIEGEEDGRIENKLMGKKEKLLSK